MLNNLGKEFLAQNNFSFELFSPQHNIFQTYKKFKSIFSSTLIHPSLDSPIVVHITTLSHVFSIWGFFLNYLKTSWNTHDIHLKVRTFSCKTTVPLSHPVWLTLSNIIKYIVHWIFSIVTTSIDFFYFPIQNPIRFLTVFGLYVFLFFSSWKCTCLFFLFFFNVYVFLREREKENMLGRGREQRRQNEKQAPGCELSAQSLTQGLNSRTVTSWPEPKSNAQLNEPPRCPTF